MSINPLFTAKKRDFSVLYGAHRVNAICSPAVHQSLHSSCSDRGAYPPSKRSRSAMEDVFGDGEDFTADDLEEIDIIASQAYTQDYGAATSRTNPIQGNRPPSTFLQPQRPAPPKRGREISNSRTNNETSVLEVLQSQHEELKQQLKVLQDDIIVKNGEIKVLRDALHQTESSLEQQRISYSVSEKEKTQMQCEKEKEQMKRIQSLQSELQFKDAEMIELKTKLQNCERRALVPQVSPKKSPSVTVKLESCPSPQPGKTSFPTKESFRANSFKPHVPVSPLNVHLPVKTESEALNSAVKQVRVFSSSYCKHSMDRQVGSVLLSTLMQQSEPLGLPGLYHLLSSNLSGPAVSSVQQAQSTNSAGTSSSNVMSPSQCEALKDYQKLAISGLNSIALGEEGTETRGSRCQKGPVHLNKMCRLPGALQILPLVEYHITAYYQALQSMEKSEVGTSDNQSMSSSSTDSSAMASAKDTVSRLTEPALASLRTLYNLVFYSLDVVETLLQIREVGKTPSEPARESSTVTNIEMDSDERMQHPLFKTIVLLLAPSVVTCKKETIREQALHVLVKLAENASIELLTRFQGLLGSHVLLQCLCPNASLDVALKTVVLLALLADDERLVRLLCSCSENCLLLSLYTYIISRPDKHASEKDWLRLDHEVVRFLNKLITQGWSPPSARSGATCLCSREVVKALVLTLHQKWLSVRRLTVLLPTPNQNKSVLFLREAVMVLHSLYQKDKSFSEHCLEVFHQYDQAVPGVRALFRKFNTLNENEEFALDELCPPEVETEDESMDCT